MASSTEIKKLFETFESIKTVQNGQERWSARDLQGLLGYTQWRRFDESIERAKDACKISGSKVSDHFVGAGKMVELGSGSQRETKNYSLSRYACYLVAQNGDSRKQEIAFAQTYFAVSTRTLEVIEQRVEDQQRLALRDDLRLAETSLTAVAYERGVNEEGLAIIRNEGDKAFFGGYGTTEMKDKLRVPHNRPLNDFTDRVVVAGKFLATALTVQNTIDKDLLGTDPIKDEHIDNNTAVRELIIKQTGKKPEEFPPREDIKKVEKRLKSDHKRVKKHSQDIER